MTETERDLMRLLISSTCLLAKLDLAWSPKLPSPAPFAPEREELRRVIDEIRRGPLNKQAAGATTAALRGP